MVFLTGQGQSHVTVHSVQVTDYVCNANHILVIELGIGVICHYNFASYDTVIRVVVSHCFSKKKYWKMFL